MANGCAIAGGLFALLVVGSCTNSCIQESFEERGRQKARAAEAEAAAKAEEEEAAREKAQKEEAKRRALQREDKLRTFTLKESPKLWELYQNLKAEIQTQNRKIEELRIAFEEFNREPERDEDFKHICAMRDEMVRSRKVMRVKIEEAYLAARKYEATPSRKDYDELRRRLLEDGIREAESATRKFNMMRDAK